MTFSMGGLAFDIDDGGLISTSTLAVQDDLLGEKLTRLCVEYGGASQAWFAQVDQNKQINWRSSFPANESPIQLTDNIKSKALRGGQRSILFSDKASEQIGIFPFEFQHQVIGLLVLRSTDADFFSPATLGWVEALAEMLSTDLVQRQQIINREQAANLVQCILRSGSNLKEDLPAVLDTFSEMLAADAVLVYRQMQIDRKRYDLFAAHGLVSPMVKSMPLLLDEKHTLAESDASLSYKALVDQPEDKRLDILFHEGNQTYISYPLIADGDVLGILEIFWRTLHNGNGNNTSPLIEEIGQALAWGFSRIKLADDLSRLNNELLSAHSATIEGLSRALELRDLETEGHTQRVCDLTLRLARHMQIPEDQHIYLLQGALLHDIGKLGIPDAILLKPGSLTPQEWKVMQQHPQHAYNILVPIVSFHESLDIPLYHHERWNGTGYPFGLHEDNIPLYARLFAVVDVFDALTSDRPYRSAWSRSQAMAYIRENAGIFFDPQIVVKFLELLENDTF